MQMRYCISFRSTIDDVCYKMLVNFQHAKIKSLKNKRYLERLHVCGTYFVEIFARCDYKVSDAHVSFNMTHCVHF